MTKQWSASIGCSVILSIDYSVISLLDVLCRFSIAGLFVCAIVREPKDNKPLLPHVAITLIIKKAKNQLKKFDK
jgi:hypothetical protein